MDSLHTLVVALLAYTACGQGGIGGMMDMMKGLPSEAWDTTQIKAMMAQMTPEQREQLMNMGRAIAGVAGDVDAKRGPPKGKSRGGKSRVTGGKDSSGSKAMSLQKAQSMMKELRNVLRSNIAAEAFAAIEGEGQERYQKAAPAAERFSHAVLTKYGFTGPGALQHAMQAATQSEGGEGGVDRDIRRFGEDIEEVLSGQVSSSRVGRVLELDAVAEKFLDMNTAARSAAIERAESTPGGEVYAATMRSISKLGDSYVVDAVADLVKKGEKAGSQPDEQVRLNVLQEFLREQEMKLVRDRLDASGSGSEL